MASLHDIVARLRRAAGLTQSELARRIGSTQSVIARLESRKVSPTIATVERIARACGFDLDVVMTPRDEVDRSQILERLSWTPRERLTYLLDMLAFENRARQARPRRRA